MNKDVQIDPDKMYTFREIVNSKFLPYIDNYCSLFNIMAEMKPCPVVVISNPFNSNKKRFIKGEHVLELRKKIQEGIINGVFEHGNKWKRIFQPDTICKK